MAALEWRVISEIIRAKNWRPVQRLNLNKGHYQDDGEARQVFEFLRQHYNHPDTLKQLPSERLLRRRFPGLQLAPEEDTPLESLIKELKYSVLVKDLKSLGATISELSDDEDPEEALRIAKGLLLKTNYQFEGHGAVNVAQVADIALQRYEDAKTGVAWGVPWPWEPLTYDTMGKKPGDLIYIYARAKNMKTWITSKSASDDFEVHKKRVIFWSREMDLNQMAMRFGAIWARVDYQLVEHGLLPPHKEIVYKEVLRSLREHISRTPDEIRELRDADQADILFLVGRDAPRSMEELRARIDEFEPDVVYLDSVHHMEPTKGGRGDSEKQRNLAEEQKQLAIDTGLPVIASGHANRDGEKQTPGKTTLDIGRTDAWGQEADLLIRVIKKKINDLWEEDYEGYWESKESNAKQARENVSRLMKLGRLRSSAVPGAYDTKRPPKARTSAELALLISGARRGTLDGIVIGAVPGYHFPVLRDEITGDEVKRWLKENEEEAQEQRGPNGAPEKAKQTRPRGDRPIYQRGAGSMGKLVF